MMRTIKTIFKYLGIILLLLVLLGECYLYTSGPELPSETDAIIESVIARPLPELIHGDTGIVDANGVKIWYENMLPAQAPKGVVLLIMGISNDALGWPAHFLAPITQAGYQVIRYDHRGTGLSDWMEDYSPEQPYDLSDMAFDAVAILDKLKIRKAHVVGISMGGMIAQQLAIDHPSRVQTLSSVMSSANILDPDLPPISSKVAYDLIKVAIKYSILPTEKNKIKLHLASRMILSGDAPYALNIQSLAEQVLYNIRERKGYNPRASEQHQTAVAQSSSRYEALKELQLPSLIIHGKEDPFIPIAHGKKCVEVLKTADYLWVENMGHDIPEERTALIIEKMLGHWDLE